MCARDKVVICVIACLIFLSALAVVISKNMHRVAFVEHHKIQKQNNKLQVEWGRLQLEYSAFRMDGHIEMLARTQLGMEYPKDIVAVEVR